MNQVEAPRNVLVVIGTGGMGLAVARRLGGGRRVLLADFSAASLDAAVTTLADEGHDVHGHIADVSDRASVGKLAADTAAVGRIDAVVHTAGVSPVTADARQIYRVDLLGTAHVIDAFYPVAVPGTSLVAVASMAGQFASLSADLETHLATAPTEELLDHEGIDPHAHPGIAYTLAKRGNQLRVQASAHAWGGKGARINTISPGVVSTPMGRAELQGEAGAHIRSMIDLSGARRVGGPDDIAAAAAFLTGPDSTFITGNDLLVDGGVISTQRWHTAAAA